MRGSDVRSGKLFSYVDLEERVPPRHPLRAIRVIVNDALAALGGQFQGIYSDIGRRSIPPEKLLRTLLLSGVSWHSLRTPDDGTARFRPVVPLVRRIGHR